MDCPSVALLVRPLSSSVGVHCTIVRRLVQPKSADSMNGARSVRRLTKSVECESVVRRPSSAGCTSAGRLAPCLNSSVGVDCMIVQRLGQPRSTDSGNVERRVRNMARARMEHVARWAVPDLDETFLTSRDRDVRSAADPCRRFAR